MIAAWVGAAALGVVLLGAAFQKLTTPSQSTGDAVETAVSDLRAALPAATGPAVTKSLPRTNAQGSQDNIGKAVDDLWSAAFATSGPSVAIVRKTHLEKFSGLKADALLKQGDFVWALVKLFLVKEHARGAAPALEDTSEEQLGTREFLVVKHSYTSAARFEHMPPEWAEMLAYASCQVWNKPSLPQVNESRPELFFVDTADCAHVKPEQASLGFSALTKWLNGLPQNPRN